MKATHLKRKKILSHYQLHIFLHLYNYNLIIWPLNEYKFLQPNKKYRRICNYCRNILYLISKNNFNLPPEDFTRDLRFLISAFSSFTTFQLNSYVNSKFDKYRFDILALEKVRYIGWYLRYTGRKDNQSTKHQLNQSILRSIIILSIFSIKYYNGTRFKLES